jgi:hypothetical protein
MTYIINHGLSICPGLDSLGTLLTPRLTVVREWFRPNFHHKSKIAMPSTNQHTVHESD